MQVIRTILPDPMNQEPLLVENIPDPLAGEQVNFNNYFYYMFMQNVLFRFDFSIEPKFMAETQFWSENTFCQTGLTIVFSFSFLFMQGR